MTDMQKIRRPGRTATWYLAIAFVFLLAQMHGAAHAAEFGPDPHDHGGVPCAVQFLTESLKVLDAPPTVIVDAPPFFEGVEHFRTVALRQPQSATDQHYIRGPPSLPL